MKRKIALTPKIQAEIAIKAMTESLREIAQEYETSEHFVYQQQKILTENAADLFLLISGDESILKTLETIRDQMEWIQESLDEMSSVLDELCPVFDEISSIFDE